jgi:hypothetical protein
MKLLDSRTLRLWGGPVLFAFAILFTVTLLLLHASLEVADDEELLFKTIDGRQKSNLQRSSHIFQPSEADLNRHSPVSPRMAFEADHPPSDLERMLASVQAIRRTSVPSTQSNMTYDIRNCPDQPIPGYPAAWSAMSILTDWNPDDTDIPVSIYQGLCIFDWTVKQDRQKVDTYRRAEQPFVLRNHPDVLTVAERWNSPGYLEQIMGPDPQRMDHATSNHLMFARVSKKDKKLPEDWKPPTDTMYMPFSEWLVKAQEIQEAEDQAERDHWYLRLNSNCRRGKKKNVEVMCDELPFFTPVQNLFMVETNDYRGINCRFGMKGSIAEAHYDSTRNWLMLFGGQRRYVLGHPNQCENLELYPNGHPSSRHARQDWSHPVATKEFLALRLNEVVLDAGDALYLPTGWFHFIVSLNINYQCNSRSGKTIENQRVLEKCGFGL